MGYASYTLPDGREGGYAVEAECDRDDCETAIDRGLGYLCGTRPGGWPFGCGGYFCGEHLGLAYVDDGGVRWSAHQMCEPCADQWKAAGAPVDPDDID
jgi:hypothetical protein